MGFRTVLPALLLPFLIAQCGGEAPPPAPPPVVTTVAAPLPAAPPPPPEPPRTPKQTVTTTYHGVAVTDDYAWLEDKADPKVKAWSDAENAFTRTILDALPDRPAIKKRVAALIGDDAPGYGDILGGGKTLFVMKTQPPRQQAFLVTVPAANIDSTAETVLVDPNMIDPTGKTTIDFFVPSHDGKLVAVSLSKGGSESGDVHIYEVASGKERVSDMIPRVNGGTAGGSVAWAGPDSIFYTRYPHEGERPPADMSVYQQVWVHKLGTTVDKDEYAIGKDFPRIAETALASSDDGHVVVAMVANGDGGDFAFYVHDMWSGRTWKQLSTFEDKIVPPARFGRDGTLYLLSHKKPRGEILRLSPATASLAKATVIVPESDAVIDEFDATNTRLYVRDVVGGPSQIRSISLRAPATGKPAPAPVIVPIPPVSRVSASYALAGDDLLILDESYLEPPAWYRFSPGAAAAAQLTKTTLKKKTPVEFGDAEVVREQCTSKDGTKVPISIIQKKGAVRDNSGYAMLTGYGGFGLNRQPRFRPINRVLLDEGVVFAEANLRGGGEFGEAWHKAGNVTNKQNVFDDFYACAKLLADEKVAPPEHLAIQGGSNGGLLMGAELTQHYDAFRVVVSHVGIYDMLHYETTFNGAFNVTEYGSVKDPGQFKALYAYSPFHNVKEGARYPAVLFMTGANDPRVEPYNSRKMTARLQAANTGRSPILLRTSDDTGHGMGTPLAAEIEENTDALAFMFHELAIPFH